MTSAVPLARRPPRMRPTTALGRVSDVSMMQRMDAPTLSAHQLRAVAVASETDPRTVARVLRGLPVRDLQGDRIRRALAARGLSVPPAEAPQSEVA